MSLRSFRGTVLPADRPEGDAERCRWGPCEAGGWILPGAPTERDGHAGAYHPGCRAAMEYANRPQREDES